jgi:hypothetical protein
LEIWKNNPDDQEHVACQEYHLEMCVADQRQVGTKEDNGDQQSIDPTEKAGFTAAPFLSDH